MQYTNEHPPNTNMFNQNKKVLWKQTNATPMHSKSMQTIFGYSNKANPTMFHFILMATPM